jgi:hypothetical protein
MRSAAATSMLSSSSVIPTSSWFRAIWLWMGSAHLRGRVGEMAVWLQSLGTEAEALKLRTR